MESPILDFYGLLSLLSMGVGIFFLAYLAMDRARYTLPNLVMGVLLFTLSFEIWNNFLIHSRLIYRFPWFFNLSNKPRLFLYSALFLYVYLITRKKIKGRDCWAFLIFIPVLIDASFWLPGFFRATETDKLRMLDLFYQDNRPGPNFFLTNPRLFITWFLLPLVYLITGWFLLRRYRSVKGPAESGTFAPLSILMIGLTIFLLIESLLLDVIYKTTSESFIEWVIALVLMSVLVILFSFYVLKVNSLKRSGETNLELPKYQRSSLSEKNMDLLLDRIKKSVREEELFLDPEISVTSLARLLNTNSAYISQAINTRLNQRFSDFINQYRVEASKGLLLDPQNDKFTIEALAHQSGFRSKSAFYKAFQKSQGQSPAEFKNLHRP
jgi:AraC-like DNA-binding protein